MQPKHASSQQTVSMWRTTTVIHVGSQSPTRHGSQAVTASINVETGT